MVDAKELGKSDVPFNQIPPTQIDRQLVYSIMDFVAINGVVVKAFGTGNNGNTELYSVPSGKVFFLISLTLQSREVTGNTAAATINDGETDFALLNGVNTAGGSNAIGFSFQVPLRLESGEVVNVFSGTADMYAYGAIVGYEVDKNILVENF